MPTQMPGRTPPNHLTLAAQLANTFSRIVREWVGDDLAELRRLNDEDDENVCHTHDFFDANAAMLDAFSELGLACPAENFDDSTARLWIAAWNFAKDSKFAHISIPDTP